MPAHLHGYKALIEKGVDVRITALCARKIDDAKSFRKRGEGHAPREPVGPPGDPLNVPHVYVQDFQKDAEVEVYDDYERMLKEADVDAVEIYTSVFSHHPIALASLKAGKHVLVEKPMAVTVKAARLMVEAAGEAGKVLGIAENVHYFPDVRMTKWAIEKGYVGEVQTIVFGIFGGYWSPNKIAAETAWRHKKLFAGGGATIDMGPHMFHFFRYLCGEVEEVSGAVEILEKVRVTRDEAGRVIDKVECDVDDTFFAMAKFRSGIVGQAFFSWSGHGEPTVVPRTIYGTKGCIKGDTLMLDGGARLEVKSLFEEKASLAVKEGFFPYGIRDPMALETLEFLRAIKEGREMETSGQEGLRDLAASYGIIESSLLNAPVRVDDVESGKIKRYEAEINKHYAL
jgi:predicted dehydrogenase